MARELREHGSFRFSWFVNKRRSEFYSFMFFLGPLWITTTYIYRNWEKDGWKGALWYSTLNNPLDDGFKMRLTQGLENPDELRARLNKLQAPEEYMSHLPADDFVASNKGYRGYQKRQQPVTSPN